jgi:hypothetical protein
MNRAQLEHILRASAAITGTDEFVIAGSQAILGRYPDAPKALLASMEADIFSLKSPEAAELIDGSIGELSPFHRTFGYYAHGIAPNTAILPSGWRERLITVKSPSTGDATGLCLEPHDLAASKLAAGREKDVAFVGQMLSERLVDPATLQQRVDALELDQPLLTLVRSRANALIGGV